MIASLVGIGIAFLVVWILTAIAILSETPKDSVDSEGIIFGIFGVSCGIIASALFICAAIIYHADKLR